MCIMGWAMPQQIGAHGDGSNPHLLPWPVWLGWLERCPITERLRVQFLVRTCAYMIPSPGADPWSEHIEATN